MMQQEFTAPQGILWDLDNTLYPSNHAVHSTFNEAVARAALEFGVPMTFEEAVQLATSSFMKHRYSGLEFVTNYGIPFPDLHHMVDKFLDTSLISRCGDTCELFTSHKGMDHALITHASRKWALQILKNIGIENWFPEHRVFAFENYDFESKARSRRPFEMALASINRNPEDCMMVEDTIENLKVPFEMGITTVYLHHGELPREIPDYVDYSFENARILLRALKPGVYSSASR